jgi:hypothetical protein
VLREGWSKYKVELDHQRALELRFTSTNPDSIAEETQRFRKMGLEEGVHFTVKMPEKDSNGYVYIRREGFEHAVWLSKYSPNEEQRKLAAEFVKYILQRACKKGGEVCEKAKEIIGKAEARGSLKLEDFKKKVKVGDR